LYAEALAGEAWKKFRAEVAEQVARVDPEPNDGR
jgi:hypothetical protein